MTATLLRAAERKVTPWKNGLGTTSEIMAYPQAAGLEDFDWRVSIATVTADGPFSHFPQIDRTLSILSGEGILLSVRGTPTRLTQYSPPFSFPGDVPASAALLGGAVMDLNVMSRRGRITHRVGALRHSTRHVATAHSFVIWVKGRGKVADFDVGPLDAVHISEDSIFEIVASDDDLAYCISFAPVPLSA
jgi:environmental stress-induced protein Ves